MAKNDMYNNITPLVVLQIGTYPDQVLGATGALDLQGYESATLYIITGNAGNPGSDITFELRESDNLAGPFGADTVVDPNLVLGGFPVIDGTNAFYADKVWKVGYVGTKRYINVFVAVANTGVTDGLPIAILLTKGDPHTAPTPVTPIAP